jgi:cell division protein FtsQ
LRSGNLFSNRGSAVLDAPEPDRARTEGKSSGLKRGAPVTEMPLRRDSAYPDDFAGDNADLGHVRRGRRPGVRLSISGGLVPTSRWGRIAAGCGLLLLAGAGVAAGLEVHRFLLRDAHFTVPNSDSIQIAGNSHLTRAQLLSVFGEDVDRNIFRIPLGERREELESLPWVEHATVMRLLPNRVRVAIVERTPVAFVRQSTQIGLVDANGVLFDMPSPEMEEASGAAANHGTAHYSFPVLTGIAASDPLSTRAARMRIYLGFVAALDASGENISRRLSEVDLSNPEDVKAVIPDAGSSTGADILVHFGEEKFLERYHQYQQHLAEWRAQYPRLASVDMRYERQVVLEMQPGVTAPATDAAAKDATGEAAPTDAKKEPVKATVASVTHAASTKATATKPPSKPTGKAAHKPVTSQTAKPATALQGVPR